MRREYLVLLLIIVLSGSYLFLRQDNRENYILPEIKQVDTAKITGLVIEKNHKPIKFVRQDKKWFVTDKRFPADQSAVEDMLSALKTFKLSLLVSENQDMMRYDLGPASRINIKALKDGDPVFQFSLGKIAPSHNHSYVMLLDDKNIYQADGNFRSHFDKTVQDFRDKKVMEFKKDSISKVIIKKDKKSKTLSRTEQLKEKQDEKAKEKAKITWASDDGKPVDRKSLDKLLSALALLKCHKFLEDISKKELEKQTALYQISLDNGSEISLSLFAGPDKDDKDAKENKEKEMKAVSSMSPDVFELDGFDNKEIVEGVESLLGINKK